MASVLCPSCLYCFLTVVRNKDLSGSVYEEIAHCLFCGFQTDSKMLGYLFAGSKIDEAI